MPFDPNDKRTAMQDVIIFLLRRLQSYGLRRYNSAPYEPIVIYEDGKRVNTHAWRPSQLYKNMEAVCNISKEDHYLQWKNITGPSKSHVIEHLKKYAEAEFAPLEPRRDLLSFRNGILRITTSQFTFYNDVPASWVSHNFIDGHYKKEWEEIPSTLKSADTWLDRVLVFSEFNNNMPNLAKIFKSQLDEEVNPYFQTEHYYSYVLKRGLPRFGIDKDADHEQKIEDFAHLLFWHYVLLGRLLFKLGDKDNWQIIQLFKGLAGTAKSTIIEMVGWFYRESDIATLGNDARKGVGNLQDCIGKALWRVFELKENFGLPQTQFQSMVSGETVVIDILREPSVSYVWDMHGILAGNSYGGWKDAAGSIQRRVIVSNFSIPISKSLKDPDLKKNLKLELPQIVVNCLYAYLYIIEKHPHDDIWNILPDYFTWTGQKLSAATDLVSLFLTNDDFEFSEHYCMVKKDFMQKLKKWGEETKIPDGNLSTYNGADDEKLRCSLRTKGCDILYNQWGPQTPRTIKEVSNTKDKKLKQRTYAVITGVRIKSNDMEDDMDYDINEGLT